MSRKDKDVRGSPLSPAKPIIPNWLIVVVIVWVMVMWSGSVIYSANNPEWPIPASVHAVVPPVVIGVMGYLALKAQGNGAGNGSR